VSVSVLLVSWLEACIWYTFPVSVVLGTESPSATTFRPLHKCMVRWPIMGRHVRQSILLFRTSEGIIHSRGASKGRFTVRCVSGHCLGSHCLFIRFLISLIRSIFLGDRVLLQIPRLVFSGNRSHRRNPIINKMSEFHHPGQTWPSVAPRYSWAALVTSWIS
jgi:hypothetical protein